MSVHPSQGAAMLRFLPLAFALASGPAVAQDLPLPNTPVPALDLKRYAGTWHEIAHLPLFFQRNCAASTTATYAVRPDGRVTVRNACETAEGKPLVSEGVARPVPGQPGALQVRFAPAWLGWLPMVWADYWVVELDPEYRWAVVGGPSRKYLWILSRTPTLSRDQFDVLRERTARRGYPVERLIQAGRTVE